MKRMKTKEKLLSPKVRKLRGIIKTDGNIDYKKIFRTQKNT